MSDLNLKRVQILELVARSRHDKMIEYDMKISQFVMKLYKDLQKWTFGLFYTETKQRL